MLVTTSTSSASERGSLLKQALVAIAVVLVTLATVIVGFFAWESVSPFQLPRYTLTNGERRVVFESMAHLASRGFYQAVLHDIREAKRQGYVYFYEGVQPSKNPETAGRLTAALTGGAVADVSLPDIHGFIAVVAGLTFQPQTIFLRVENDDDVNVDVSADELVARLPTAPPVVPPSKVATASDLEALRLSYAELGETAKAFLRVVVRNGISGVLRLAGDRFSLGALDRDLVRWRNDVLVDHLMTGPPNVIVTYGAIHFHGMLAELQAHDPRWHVEDVAWRPVFR